MPAILSADEPALSAMRSSRALAGRTRVARRAVHRRGNRHSTRQPSASGAPSMRERARELAVVGATRRQHERELDSAARAQRRRCREPRDRRRRSTPVRTERSPSAPSAAVMSPSSIGCALPGERQRRATPSEPRVTAVGRRRPFDARGIDLDIAADERSGAGSRRRAEKSGGNRCLDIAKFHRIAADCDVSLRRRRRGPPSPRTRCRCSSRRRSGHGSIRHAIGIRVAPAVRIPRASQSVPSASVRWTFALRHRGEARVGKARRREPHREQRNRRRERGEDEERARHVDWRARQRASVSSARTVPGSTRAVSVASTARRFPSR